MRLSSVGCLRKETSIVVRVIINMTMMFKNWWLLYKVQNKYIAWNESSELVEWLCLLWWRLYPPSHSNGLCFTAQLYLDSLLMVNTKLRCHGLRQCDVSWRLNSQNEVWYSVIPYHRRVNPLYLAYVMTHKILLSPLFQVIFYFITLETSTG